MTKNQWLITIGVLVLIGAGVVWWGGRIAEPTGTIDLASAFGTAEKRTDLPPQAAFSVGSFTINGDSRRGIYAHATSRISWHLNIPENARLRVSLGLKQEVWDKPGDGVVFRVGVNEGNRYEELLRQHVHPAVWAADRRWIPVTLDLSRVGGREADIVFTTDKGPDSFRIDPRYDWAVWGTPEIVVYR